MRIVQIVKVPDKRQEQIKTATFGFFLSSLVCLFILFSSVPFNHIMNPCLYRLCPTYFLRF